VPSTPSYSPSLGERFFDGTSTYPVIFQAPRVSKYEFVVSTGEEVLVFLLFFLQRRRRRKR
jgi:hypothetical protein